MRSALGRTISLQLLAMAVIVTFLLAIWLGMVWVLGLSIFAAAGWLIRKVRATVGPRRDRAAGAARWEPDGRLLPPLRPVDLTRTIRFGKGRAAP
jgi:hypothetical protein